MPEENYAGVPGPSISRACGVSAEKQPSEFDQMAKGLEELYQRLLSQYHVQENVLDKLFGARIQNDIKEDDTPECPPNGQIDMVNRGIIRCLRAMNKIENSFRSFHKL